MLWHPPSREPLISLTATANAPVSCTGQVGSNPTEGTASARRSRRAAVSSRLAMEPAMPLLTVKWRPRVNPRAPPAPAPTQDPSQPLSNASTHAPGPPAQLHTFIATAAGTFRTPHRAHLLPAPSPRDIHRSHISGRASFPSILSAATFLSCSHAFTLLSPFAFFCLGRSPPFFLGFSLWAPVFFLINRALLFPKYDCLSAPQRAMQCAFLFAGRLDPPSGAGQMRLGSPPFRNLRSLSRAPRGKLLALLLEPRLSAGPSRPQIKSC